MNKNLRRCGRAGCRGVAGWVLFVCVSFHAGFRDVHGLVITEVMYHSDEPDDKTYEFIELYNDLDDPLDLTGYSICNGVDFSFPRGTWLDGKKFLVVCASKAAIQGKYGIANAIGDWLVDPVNSRTLGNGGEQIEVCNPGGKTVAEVRYNDRGKWPSGADGTGHSLEIKSPYRELDDPDSWELSNARGGSPGLANPCWEVGGGGCVDRVPVRINEAFLRTGGAEPWVELYNKGEAGVNLGGYYLTDDPADLTKSRIPDGTVIGSKAYLTFDESDLGFPLAVTAVGERRFLALTEPALTHRVVDAFNFEPEFEGYSEARVPGDDKAFSPAADPTRSGTNAVSVTTDLVINEVMYHPIDNDSRKEYVELFNRGPVAIDLTGFELSDGVRYAFPPGTTIPSGGYLVVARDPALIQGIYGLSSDDAVGPIAPEDLAYFGVLRDRGERLTLSDPLGRTVDSVRFHDGGKWPEWADGKGSSLELIDASQDNRAGQAWDASDDSAKAVMGTYSYVARHGNRESELSILLLDRGITVVDDISILGGGVSVVDTPIIDFGETWRYFKGTQEPPATWKQLSFDDSAWLSGATGIGYGDNDDATVLTDMQNGYMTVFCRKVFNVADKEAIDELWLNVTIDDGFYAYLNGTQVAAVNVASPAFDAAAPSAVEPNPSQVDITSFKNILVSGTNVLAIQVHNAGLASTDVSFNPSLVDRTTTTSGGTEQVANGHFNTNASGWMIEGTHVRSGRTTQSPLSGAGSLKIVASGRGDNKTNRIETPDAAGTGLGSLTANQDVVISFKAKWVIGAQTILTHGYDHEMARSHILDVPLDLGTPGAVNSVTLRQQSWSGGNLGPVITDVSNDPPVPAGGETVVVRAQVRDSDGVAAVRIYYSLNNPSASPTVVNMTLVEDDVYQATIPAQSQGTRVVFYITATDGVGNAGRYPIDVRERTHPLLLDPAAASLNDLRYCIYRHDVKNPSTTYASYRFYMTQADEQILSDRPRLSNDPLQGTFVFGANDAYYESKVRFSGSPWARQKWSGSYRLRMPKDDPLHGWMRTFNLEDNQGNPLSAKTRISHYLIRQSQGSIGVPYTDRFTLVRWQVNDRVTVTREHNWVPNGDFLSLWFPGDDEGDFIEMDDRFLVADNNNGDRLDSADGRVLHPPPYRTNDASGTNKENYRWFFGLRAKNGADEYANFMAFAKVMDPSVTPDALFDQQIWDFANVEEMVRIWAVEMNVDDWDTWGCSRGKNCYFYRPEADGRFHLMGWDFELTYGNLNNFIIPATPSSAFNPGGFNEVNRMLNRPAIKRLYYGVLSEMVNGTGRWFHSSRLSGYASKLAAIGMQETAIATAGGWIDQKASLLETRIRTVVYPQLRLAITTNGGSDFSVPGLTVDLAGTAPVDVFTIVVVGQDRPVTFSSMTNWSIQGIPLLPGVNNIAVFGLDVRGNILDSDSIKIASTTDWKAPVIDSLDPTEAMQGENIAILGSEFHNGVQVYFGATQSTAVAYDENGPNPGRITARVPSGTGTVNVTVKNLDNRASNPVPFTYLVPPSMFVRGDANGDEFLDISDAVKILLHLFAGRVTDCEDAMDLDDNEDLDITDPVFLVNFLFRSGPEPFPPYPSEDIDPSGTALGCTR